MFRKLLPGFVFLIYVAGIAAPGFAVAQQAPQSAGPPPFSVKIAKPPTGTVFATGTINVQVSIVVISPGVLDGTVLNLTAGAVPSDLVDGDYANVSGSVAIASQAANLTIALPFGFPVSSLSDKIVVTLSGVGASTSYGSVSTSVASQTVALPANGGSVTVSFSAAL